MGSHGRREVGNLERKEDGIREGEEMDPREEEELGSRRRRAEMQGEEGLKPREIQGGDSWLLAAGVGAQRHRGTRGSRGHGQTRTGSPTSWLISVTGDTRTGPGRTSPTAGPAGTVPASSTGEGQPWLRASRGSCFPALPDFSTGCEVGAGVVAEPVPMGTRGGYHIQTTLGCLGCHWAWICPFLPAGSSSCSRDQPG